MPHVIVKLWPGKSEEQKARLADKIVRDVMDVLDYGEESVSVGFEESNRRIGKRRSTGQIFRTTGTISTRSRDTRCNLCRSRAAIRVKSNGPLRSGLAMHERRAINTRLRPRKEKPR
jgi:phenylpyruvate tautomerase PptA (4-oxalocrotonate tautomerase family)